MLPGKLFVFAAFESEEVVECELFDFGSDLCGRGWWQERGWLLASLEECAFVIACRRLRFRLLAGV